MHAQTSPFTWGIILMLVEAVLCAFLWLWNEYVAVYLTLIFPSIVFIVLVLAKIADWIEPSRISRWYYIYMLISIITPLLIGVLFYSIYEGQLDWLTE